MGAPWACRGGSSCEARFLAALARGQTTACGKLFMPQPGGLMLYYILLTTGVFAGLVVVVLCWCCDFSPVGSDGDKEGAPQQQSRRQHAGLGRLTDPSVWAELEAQSVQ